MDENSNQLENPKNPPIEPDGGTEETLSISYGSDDELGEEFQVDNSSIKENLIYCLEMGNFAAAAALIIQHTECTNIFNEVNPINKYFKTGYQEEKLSQLAKEVKTKKNDELPMFACNFFLNLSPIFRLIDEDIMNYIGIADDNDIDDKNFKVKHKIDIEKFKIFFGLLQKNEIYVDFLHDGLLALKTEMKYFKKNITENLEGNWISYNLLPKIGYKHFETISRLLNRICKKSLEYKKRINELDSKFLTLKSGMVGRDGVDCLYEIRMFLSHFLSLDFYFDRRVFFVKEVCGLIKKINFVSEALDENTKKKLILQCEKILSVFEGFARKSASEYEAMKIVDALLFLAKIFPREDVCAYRVANVVTMLADKYEGMKNSCSYREALENIDERLKHIKDELNKDIFSEHAAWTYNLNPPAIEFTLLSSKIGYGQFKRAIGNFLHKASSVFRYEYKPTEKKIIISDVFLINEELLQDTKENFSRVLIHLIHKNETRVVHPVSLASSVDNIGFFEEPMQKIKKLKREKENKERSPLVGKQKKRRNKSWLASIESKQETGLVPDPDLYEIMKIVKKESMSPEDERKLDQIALGYSERSKNKIKSLRISDARFNIKQKKQKSSPSRLDIKKTEGNIIELTEPMKEINENMTELSLDVTNASELVTLELFQREEESPSIESLKVPEAINLPSTESPIFKAARELTQKENFSFFSQDWGGRSPLVPIKSSEHNFKF